MKNFIKIIIVTIGVVTALGLFVTLVDTDSHETIAFQTYVNSLELGETLDVESCKYKARYCRQIIFHIETITKEKTVYYINVDMTEDGYYFSKETYITVDKNNLIIDIKEV